MFKVITYDMDDYEINPKSVPFTTYELIINSPATLEEMSAFAKTMFAEDYDLGEPIAFDDYMPIAVQNMCFMEWLVEAGYIVKKKKDDEWDPDNGEWVEIGWDMIEYLVPGVMINRIIAGKPSVMKIIRAPYWRKHWDTQHFLAIEIKRPPGYAMLPASRYTYYYLADLFDGGGSVHVGAKVYIKKPLKRGIIYD